MDAPARAAAKHAIEERARALGFEAIGFAGPEHPAPVGQGLESYLASGYHGDMAWMADKSARRAEPRRLWPQTRTIIALGMNYGPEGDPLAVTRRAERGAVSVYAHGDDYHKVMKRRLKELARFIHRSYGAEVKVFVDTAPVMEKPAAERAGLGWQGKHTNLVSRAYGSWLFLGEIFTALELPPDEPERDYCGSCHACLDVCPTDAFPAPYRLDARRCISYLTIEHKGHIPREFREAMGNRVFGCDDCLAVCPWNKFARLGAEAAFLPRADLKAPRLADLARLDDAAFRALFAGTTIKRTGRDRFVRNVLIALGNAGDPAEIPVVEALLEDSSPLVRAMAVWALSRLGPRARFAALKARLRPGEPDPAVRVEWDEADEPPARAARA